MLPCCERRVQCLLRQHRDTQRQSICRPQRGSHIDADDQPKRVSVVVPHRGYQSTDERASEHGGTDICPEHKSDDEPKHEPERGSKPSAFDVAVGPGRMFTALEMCQPITSDRYALLPGE